MVVLYEDVRDSAPPAAPAPEPAPPEPTPRRPDPEARRLWSKEITASADYHQVAIADFEINWPNGVDEDAADEARAVRRHVGWADGYAVMFTPSQWQWEMPVRVEGWSAEPAELGDWQEIVDIDLRIDSGTLTLMAPMGEGHEVEVPAGRYRARICGGGFTGNHMDGDEEGSDRYLIRLWPSSEPGGPRQLRTWSGWAD